MNKFPSAHYMRRRYAIAHRLAIPFYYPYRWLRGARPPDPLMRRDPEGEPVIEFLHRCAP